jgi:SH3 domain protein
MLLRALSGLAISISLPAIAQQRMYTSDELIVLLRTGPSIENAIVRNMRPGTALDVLDEDAGNAYSRVRLTGSDVEGFVLSQYLSPERAARDLLEEAERTLATTRARVQSLETEVTELETELRATQDMLAAERSSGGALSAELASIREASANAVALRDQNESLRRRVSELTAETEAAAIENSQLGSRSRQNWFVVGAAVLFAGIVIGLIAPTLRRTRRSSW